jgi:hypothetical protein
MNSSSLSRRLALLRRLINGGTRERGKRRSAIIVEFCRWENSLSGRIPKAVADALKVSNGKRSEIRIENGTLVLRRFG